MPNRSHRSRRLVFTLLGTSALILPVRPAHGGWSTEPVEVHATSALCPLVSVIGEAQGSSIVVWQENTASGGLLRARRLLASGDLDPAWSSAATVSDRDVARRALGGVSDGAGGAYVWWMEGAQLYLSRLTSSGEVATGWPITGRALGALVNAGSRPVICSDGSGGVYAAWLASSGLIPAWMTIRAHHLGPANTAKDGWPNDGRTLASTRWLQEHVNTFGIATAGDGGLWLAYGSTVVQEDAMLAPGEVRVARLTASGIPATGWSTPGMSLAPFRGELLAGSYAWGLTPPMHLIAVAPGADGDAFVVFGEIASDGYNVGANYRLQRVDAFGTVAPGWPAGGRSAAPLTGLPAWDGRSAATSLVLHPDLAGGVFVGRPGFYSHGVDYGFQHVTAVGTSVGEAVRLFGAVGLESQARADGGVVAASFYPVGPYGPYQPSAFLQLDQSDPGASFVESHAEPVIEWYGDIGLAATGDGGSIFAWSQVNEREGIFAIRMNPPGQVTEVTPAASPRSFRVWFARGAGIRVTGGAGGLSLRLHDVIGREVARGESGAADGEWTVPGTAELPSGIYFVKGTVGGKESHARVAVIR